MSATARTTTRGYECGADCVVGSVLGSIAVLIIVAISLTCMIGIARHCHLVSACCLDGFHACTPCVLHLNNIFCKNNASSENDRYYTSSSYSETDLIV